MLTKILTSLALTVGLIHPSIASEIKKMPTDLICGSDEGIGSVLEEFDEIPFATMSSFRDIAGQNLVENTMIIFANPKTKTYTIVEQFGQNIYCVVAIGENIAPYTEK